MRTLLLILAPVLVSATNPVPQCEAQKPVPASITTPRATYYSDGEPPARYAHAPPGTMKVRFGQAAVDDLCKRPLCGLRFLGCVRGDQMAILDPFTMSNDDFAKLVRHELAHLSGWPDTHGE